MRRGVSNLWVRPLRSSRRVVSDARKVGIEQLRPFVIFVIVIGSVGSLHAFTQFFVLTGGGPGYDTATLGFQLYQQAFVLRNTGYAAALAVVLFLITIVLSLAQLAASRSLRPAD